MNCIVCAVIPRTGPIEAIKADVVVDGHSMCMPHAYTWISQGRDEGLIQFLAREKRKR